jgi:pimeloyl-ACP methyl ester carboxylesterase
MVRTRTIAIAALALAMAGCAPTTAPPSTAAPVSSPATTPAPAEPPCGDRTLDGKQVTFLRDDLRLSGYLLGAGSTALVLAAQAGADGCSWLSYAKQQAAKGYRVLAFDFNGEGRSQRPGGGPNSADVAAAATFARERGATRIVLVGASRGGTAVLVAAARLDPPAAAVISLSAPDTYHGESALDAVPKLAMPVLYLAATGDAGFADAAKALHAATPAARRQIILVPGRLHGEAFVLISAEGADEASAAIDAFLAAHAPAT